MTIQIAELEWLSELPESLWIPIEWDSERAISVGMGSMTFIITPSLSCRCEKEEHFLGLDTEPEAVIIRLCAFHDGQYRRCKQAENRNRECENCGEFSAQLHEYEDVLTCPTCIEFLNNLVPEKDDD